MAWTLRSSKLTAGLSLAHSNIHMSEAGVDGSGIVGEVRTVIGITTSKLEAGELELYSYLSSYKRNFTYNDTF